MARAQSTDFYHVFKFHVVDSENRLNRLAGFNSVSSPELTLEAVEYKEGIWTYRRKFPGDVTISDITMTRGVAKQGTFFYDWIRDAVEGNKYRVDFKIYHFHRDDVQGLTNYINAKPSRVINIFEAFPIRIKPGTDFEASTSEVAIEELDIAIERFTIEYS